MSQFLYYLLLNTTYFAREDILLCQRRYTYFAREDILTLPEKYIFLEMAVVLMTLTYYTSLTLIDFTSQIIC